MDHAGRAVRTGLSRTRRRLRRARRRLTRRENPRASVLRRLPLASTGAEIGVWTGDFSARLLEELSPTRLHLVDPWAFIDDEEHERARYGGKLVADQADMDTIYQSVLERFGSEIDEGRVVVHRERSRDAASTIDGGSLDWVYIDGDHLYEAVLDDLRTYVPKVRAGGLVVLDDYGVRGWWEDGVTRAAATFLAGEEHRVVAVEESQLILRV